MRERECVVRQRGCATRERECVARQRYLRLCAKLWVENVFLFPFPPATSGCDGRRTLHPLAVTFEHVFVQVCEL